MLNHGYIIILLIIITIRRTSVTMTDISIDGVFTCTIIQTWLSRAVINVH